MIAAAPYLIWGVVLHLIADWPLQNEWMAKYKAVRRARTTYDSYYGTENGWKRGPWWDRHPAAYVHAGIHGAIQLLIFPWWAALFIAATHLLIDTRVPVVWWSQKIGQTQPRVMHPMVKYPTGDAEPHMSGDPLYSIGTEVRFWTDQVFHIAIVAVAALAVVWL